MSQLIVKRLEQVAQVKVLVVHVAMSLQSNILYSITVHWHVFMQVHAHECYENPTFIVQSSTLATRATAIQLGSSGKFKSLIVVTFSTHLLSNRTIIDLQS